MALIGDLLANLTGMKRDPQEAIMASAAAPATDAPTPGAPMPIGPGAAAPAGGPPAAQGAMPAPAAAPPAPPDLGTLYAQLLKQDRRDRAIDSGLTLMAAGIARPENRAALIQSASASGNQSNPASTLKTLMELQNSQASAAQKAQLRAQLPAIAAKYGIDQASVNVMFESGKLDDLLKDLNQHPGTSVVTDPATGKQVLINQRTGDIVKKYDTGLAPDNKVIENKGTGESTIVNANSPAQRTTVAGSLPMDTADTKNYDRYKADEAARGNASPLSFNDWSLQQNKSKAERTITDNTTSEIAKGFAKTWTDDYATAKDAAEVHSQVKQARSILEDPKGGIIAGSVLSGAELEGRKVMANLFGIPDKETHNTETFKAAMNNLVMEKVKALGSGNGITDADVKFTQQALGGDISMTPESMRRILRAVEMGTRINIIKKNAEVDKMIAENPALKAHVRKVDVPEADPSLFGHVDPRAIEYLTAHPETAKDFDKRYGGGAHLSRYILGK